MHYDNYTNFTDKLSCLRSTDVDVLTQANNAIGAANFFGTYAWVPAVDGTFSTEWPLVLLEKGQLNGASIQNVCLFLHTRLIRLTASSSGRYQLP